MSATIISKRRPSTANRPGEAGMIHAAARAEVARALNDLSAILAGLDLTESIPRIFVTTRMPRRRSHVRR